MLKYLLTTDEGEQVVVNSTQAGELIQTPSGRTVEVPPLRELRQLPLHEEGRSKNSPGEWNRAAGLLFAVGFLLMLIGVGIGSYVMLTLPEKAIVEPLETEMIDSEFQKMPANVSLEMWIEFSEPGYLDKIRDFRTQNEMINLYRTNRTYYAMGCFAVGLVGLALLVGAAALGLKRRA
ncbi:MAG: hypothetical protein ACIALR_02155 [Blastopirellula sp. JB062]